MTTIKARPTLYKGIQMRSRLEADYAAHLDRNGETWEYEASCFASDGGQWLPDFRVGETRTLQEVKSAHLLEREEGENLGLAVIDRIDKILKRMTIAWQSEPDAWLELIFWSYGATDPVLTVLGHQTRPWVAFGGGLLTFPLAWLGMGQDVTLIAPLLAKNPAA